jgi:hypothetical protein
LYQVRSLSMHTFLKILLSSVLICVVIADVVIAEDSLTKLLPESLDGWRRSEATQIYDRENLFDYINGGAEIYLAYDFQQLAVQKYALKMDDSLQRKSVIAEVWQMNSAADAYGVYSLDQMLKDVDIGQKGGYDFGLLRFWKGRYFVKILGLEDNLKETILKLGRFIEKEIKEQGKLPSLVSKLPSDSLMKRSVRFFHKSIILKNLYFFEEQNVLHVYKLTNCVLADYKTNEQILKLLLIQYPDTTIAKKVQEKLQTVYLSDETYGEDKIFRTKEREIIGLDREGNYLALVFEGSNRKDILWLLDMTKSRLD